MARNVAHELGLAAITRMPDRLGGDTKFAERKLSIPADGQNEFRLQQRQKAIEDVATTRPAALQRRVR
ncbi:MAG: hypothetical protein JWQ89_1425 [Devosia sp.]|nr:hypothetical protein [Devosia sp.]